VSYQFAVVAGSQQGVYDSVKTGSSQEGVHFSEFMTNLNVDNVVVGDMKIIFTGRK
jgi:hypothetical protein